MTLIRKLGLVVCLAFSLTSYSVTTNAQQVAGTVDQYTSNLINSTATATDTSSTWQNVGQFGGSLTCWAPGGQGYCGPNPYVNANGAGSINFSYGTADLYQNINIANAIAIAAGTAATGVQVKGFNFSFTAKNGNGWDNGQQDYLSAYVKLYGSAGNQVAAYDYTSYTNQKYNWTNFNFTETFATPYAVSALQSARVGLIGRDTNGWAGPYGPEVKDVNFRLSYGVDPCVNNPAYSTTCPGFSSVVESANLVPNPDGYAYAGYSINNSFALNKAFEQAGTGLQIHGFKWGYVANANGPYCAFWLIVCFDERYPSVTTNVSITSNTGATLYSVERNYQYSYNTTNYSYLFPQSQQLGNLGSFNFTATTNDPQAYIGSMWAKAIYTPDQCMKDPLSSTNCPGYYTALATQQAITTATSTPTTETTTVSPTSTTSGSTSASLSTSPTGTVTDSSQPVTTTTTSSSSTTTSAPATTTATATTSVTPTATNPQPKVGEVTVSGSAPKMTMSTAQVLSIVRNEQSRIGNLETSTAQQAVEQAQAAGDKAQKDSVSISMAVVSQSQASSQSVATMFSSNPSQGGNPAAATGAANNTGNSSLVNPVAGNRFGAIDVLRAPDVTTGVVQSAVSSIPQQGRAIEPVTVEVVPVTSSQPASIYSLTTPTFVSSAPTTVAMAMPSVPYSLFKPMQESVKTNEESTRNEGIKFTGTNPLSNMMNPTPTMPTPTVETKTESSVNTKAQDNDAAGGVSIASIAKQPVGFESYMSALKDAAFYPPREVYQNQRVVDNARAQRLLSGASDRLHQQMVEQQYKGN